MASFAEHEDLLIKDVEETGVELGRGSYGVVFEVKWRGKVRAAKKLHDFFFWPEVTDSPGTQKELRNFKSEIRSWAKLEHYNMVRLLGVYYNPSRSVRVPIIVMEKMDISLGDYLEKHTRQAVPLHKKVWVLLQVARALSYLHSQSPPLVHHDLKPDNIMIATTTFAAKLTDFGMIRTITHGNLTRASSKKGTPVFMPPEALEIPLRYDEKLDVFSYGVVIISTLVHDKAPLPSAAVVNQGGRAVPVSEFDRRKFHTDMFTPEEQRLFLPMIEQCLEFTPGRRPLSSHLVDGMSTILETLPETLEEKVAMLERRCLQAEAARGAMEESHIKLVQLYEELYVGKLPDGPKEACDTDASCKECKQLYEEKKAISQRSAELQQQVADMEYEVKGLREFKARYNKKKKKKEMERINAELHQKIFTMEQELKELRVFKAEVTSASAAEVQKQRYSPLPASGFVGGDSGQPLPPGWECQLVHGGKRLYINTVTRQTSWDRPSEDWYSGDQPSCDDHVTVM